MVKVTDFSSYQYNKSKESKINILRVLCSQMTIRGHRDRKPSSYNMMD